MIWAGLQCRVVSGLKTNKTAKVLKQVTWVNTMNKINWTIRAGALLAVSLALSACGAIPTAADRAQRDVATEATEGQSVANNSGLGTVVYDKKTTGKCKRVRSTGSNMRRSSCTPPDSASQAVRVVVYTEPVPTTNPGMSRPNN